MGKFDACLSSFVLLGMNLKGLFLLQSRVAAAWSHLLTLQLLLYFQFPKLLSCSFLGGWQEQVTYPHHAQNLLLFHQMLQRNGFRQEHIKAFFASEGQASGTL